MSPAFCLSFASMILFQSLLILLFMPLFTSFLSLSFMPLFMSLLFL